MILVKDPVYIFISLLHGEDVMVRLEIEVRRTKG